MRKLEADYVHKSSIATALHNLKKSFHLHLHAHRFLLHLSHFFITASLNLSNPLNSSPSLSIRCICTSASIFIRFSSRASLALIRFSSRASFRASLTSSNLFNPSPAPSLPGTLSCPRRCVAIGVLRTLSLPVLRLVGASWASLPMASLSSSLSRLIGLGVALAPPSCSGSSPAASSPSSLALALTVAVVVTVVVAVSSAGGSKAGVEDVCSVSTAVTGLLFGLQPQIASILQK